MQVKFGFYVAAAFLFVGLFWWSHHVGYRTGYDHATAAMEKHVAQANEATRVAEIHSREAVRVVESEYQDKLGQLDSKYRDAADRLGAVRVCQPGGGGPVPRSHPAARIPDGPARGGELPRAPAPDLGPALVAMARDADACAARLTGLQEYVRTRF